MFFPATQGDDVVLDPEEPAADRDTEVPSGMDFNEAEEVLLDSNASPNRRRYLNKPTIIMCNPNALIYQWMVTSANAYWLDFFLRRDCNVIIWNYRGYGESQQSMLSPNLTRAQQQLDVERVL